MICPGRVHFVFSLSAHHAGVIYLRDLDGEGEGELNGFLYRLHKRLDSHWPINLQFSLPVQQGHGLKNSGQAEDMIPVHVGDENLCFSMEAHPGLDHLPLRAFATVEENDFILSSNGDGRQASLRRWDASCGS